MHTLIKNDNYWWDYMEALAEFDIKDWKSWSYKILYDTNNGVYKYKLHNI